ncbi:MAG: hypothetical protein HFF17_10605 [Oscillospiraceae bacterium]|nr:hypothetical protein [Oscillospiraceae bacterium]
MKGLSDRINHRTEALDRFLSGLGRRERGVFLRRCCIGETAAEIAATYRLF